MVHRIRSNDRNFLTYTILTSWALRSGARDVPSAEVSLYMLIELCIGPFLVWLAMGEQPTWQVLVGAGGIFLTMGVESWQGPTTMCTHIVPVHTRRVHILALLCTRPLSSSTSPAILCLKPLAAIQTCYLKSAQVQPRERV